MFGGQMLYNVGFRQSPQTEDVAKLIFWLDLILSLDLWLHCCRNWWLVAHLATEWVWVLCLGGVEHVSIVLTLWWYGDVFGLSGFGGFPPLWSVGPVCS